jgi:hypothetical protein
MEPTDEKEVTKAGKPIVNAPNNGNRSRTIVTDGPLQESPLLSGIGFGLRRWWETRIFSAFQSLGQAPESATPSCEKATVSNARWPQPIRPPNKVI